MLPSVAPFATTFTPEVPDLLAGLRCSVALSTYQAGKVVVFAPKGEELSQLNRTFDSPMGLAVDGEGEGLRFAVATQDRVEVLANAPSMASNYPAQPGVYDALLLPRATYHTGPLDLHDLAWARPGGQGAPALVGVNTRFSCLCRITEARSFEAFWQPRFISVLDPGDRCHLNGMAVENGRPRYVTALGATDTPRGWSDGRLLGGVVVDVDSGETVAAGLAMPHSPRLAFGALWVLLSATGELARVDPASGRVEVVTRLGGFARGLAVRGDYLFIGLSKIRQRSTFAGLPVSGDAGRSGIAIVHAPSGRVAGKIEFLASVEEVYDVAVLPETGRPGVVGTHQDAARRAIVVEGGGYWAVPAEG